MTSTRILLGALAALSINSLTTYAVTITQQPDPIVFAVAGQSATVRLTATGTGGVSYQWRKFGQPITGATASTLTLTNVASADAGLFDAVISDGSSSTTSQACRVEVRPASNPTALRPNPHFAPQFEIPGGVRKIVSIPTGGFYAVGSFTSVDGNIYAGIARFLANSTIDSTFHPAIFDSEIDAVALQADGRIVVGGSFLTANGRSAVKIARLNVDGTLDTTFNTGSGFTGNTFSDASVLALAVQSDGKILVGGNFLQYNGKAAGLFVRLNTDGSADTAVTAGGGFSTDLANQVTAIALQPDGKIIVAGAFNRYAGASCSVPARINPNGTLDTTFNASVPYGAGFFGGAYSVAVQADSRILVGGFFLNGISNVGLYRLSSTGAVDSSFGVIPISTNGGFRGITAIGVQTDGRIVVGGYFTSLGGFARGSIARVASDGSLDTTFAANGGFDDSVESLMVETDGRIVCGGNFSTFGGVAQSGLSRLNSDGTLNGGIKASIRTPGSVNAIVPAPGGKWVVVGTFKSVNGTARGCIARLNADGAIDTGFATGAGFTYDFGLPVPSTLCVQPDGKIIVGGKFSRYDGTARSCIARLNTDGSLDTSFAVGTGVAMTSQIPEVDRLCLQADGRVLAGGIFDTYNSTSAPGLMRLNSNGTIDSTFTPAVTYKGVSFLIPLGDGKFLVGGSTPVQPFSLQFLPVRLNSNGSLDPTFDTAHRFDNQPIQAAAVQPDGRYLFASSTTDIPVTRASSTGAVDGSFYADAMNNPQVGAAVLALALQADGKVVMAGSFSTINGVTANSLGRVTADGTTDATLSVTSLVYSRNLRVNDFAFSSDGGLLAAGGRFNFTDRVAAGLVALEPVPIPVIVSQPSPQTGTEGSTATLSVTATGETLQYQWLKNGAAIPGATNSTLNFGSLSPSDAGSYAVTISSAGQSVTSNAVFISVAYSRITNASIRSFAAGGDQTLTMGFVLSGSGAKQMLVRGIGPTLATYGVTSSMADPRLQLFNSGSTSVASNNDWSGTALANLFTQVSAFPLPLNSKDAAIGPILTPGGYTAQISSDTTTGVALVEAYDAEPANYSAKLINVSARTQVGTGEDILIMGFFVSGNVPKKVLVRGIGPTLVQFGVTGVLNDPQLKLYDSNSQVIQTNDNWGGDVALQTAFSQTGAFALPAASRDAAMVITLQPGLYTVHVSGVGNTTGVAMAEVYEIP